MPKGAPEPQQQQGDRSLDFLWMVVLVVGATLLLWYFGKVYITMGIFQVRRYEIAVIEFAMKYWIYFAKVFNLPFMDLKPLQDWSAFIKENYGAAVEFKVIGNLSAAVGQYLRFPSALLLLMLGAFLYFAGAAQRFRSVYNMQTLKQQEHINWPQITPVVKINLDRIPLDDMPWAVAQDPMRFCKKYHLLSEEITKGGKPTVTLRRGAAYRVLSLQLGPQWRSVNVLPNYLQAIFAIFAARINGDKKSADELTDKIAASSMQGAPEFFNARELLVKHVNAKPVQKIVALHGYVTTVMASLLAASREVGVFSTAEFMWLKPIDRRMWYVLNCVGRYTAFAEVAGVFAHWLAEKKLGLPLMVPMVEEAVRGLEVALSEVIYKPDEE